MNNKVFKICSIGCGSMATGGHGPSYKKYAQLNYGVELSACCDLNEQAAEVFKNKFGFRKSYTDIDTMLERERPDAVCLIVPVQLTAKLSIHILRKGYPLLMEKPPGMNREETMEMITVAKNTGIANQVAFNRRYMPLMRELKSILVQNFQPKDIQNIRYDFFRVNRKEPDFSTTAIHGIDTVRYLAGSDYKYIRFQYQKMYGLEPEVCNIYMYCEFESGTIAQLSFCPVTGTIVERATVNVYNHTFFLDLPIRKSIDISGRLLHVSRGEIKLNVTGKDVSDGDEAFEKNGFYAENAAFFDDLRAGRKPDGDVSSGLQAVEIGECIRRRLAEYRI